MNKHTQWYWCIRCERAFKTNSEESFQFCLYQECRGSDGDIWDWHIIRELNPSYPVTPALGQVYPLHAEHTDEN